MNKASMKSLIAVLALSFGAALGTLGVSNSALADEKPAAPKTEKPAAEKSADKPSTDKPATNAPANGDDKSNQASKPQEKKDVQSTDKLVYVKMSTSKGDVFMELNNEKAPISVKNFLSYVDKGHYAGTIFHRVIRDFMIQGGGFTKDMVQKPTDPPIKNEWNNGLKNTKGTVSMARTSQHDSATTQFFINVVDNPFLDQPRDGAAYAVFGKVVAGMPVVDAIRMVKTGTKGGNSDVPTDTVTINAITHSTKAEADAAAAGEKK